MQQHHLLLSLSSPAWKSRAPKNSSCLAPYLLTVVFRRSQPASDKVRRSLAGLANILSQWFQMSFQSRYDFQRGQRSMRGVWPRRTTMTTTTTGQRIPLGSTQVGSSLDYHVRLDTHLQQHVGAAVLPAAPMALVCGHQCILSGPFCTPRGEATQAAIAVM